MSVKTASSASAARVAESTGPARIEWPRHWRAFELWRDRDYARRREAIAAIARAAGYSVAMLENSIDALLKPFTIEALKSIGRADFVERQERQAKDGRVYRRGQCCRRRECMRSLSRW